MRRLAHQLAIFKSTGFAFVRITYQITRYALWLGQETPFQSRGEAGTASSPKARFLDFFQHILRTHALEGLFNGCITSRSEEHTSELQSLMRISYAVFCFKKKK